MKTLFYGWWLVAVCLVVNAVGAGITLYAYSLFAAEFERDFEISRALAMLAFTGYMLFCGLLSPLLGDLLDRYSIKWTMAGTAALMGFGFVMMSFSPTIWVLVVTYSLLIAAGGTTLTMLAPPVLLARWFTLKRGVAIGTAAMGTQLGGILIPPLLAVGIEATDWRMAMRVVGIITLVGLPLLIYATVIDDPARRGLRPDGAPEPGAPEPGAPEPAAADDADTVEVEKAATAAASPPTASMWEVLAQRDFWLIVIGLVAIMSMLTALLSNLALFASDAGASREASALLISLFAFMGMVFSPVIGRLCDVLDVRAVFAGLLLVNMIGLGLFFLADGYAMLAVATSFVAIGAGGLTPVWGALIARMFDLAIYSRAMGMMGLFAIPASAGAPTLSGWLYDVTGHYQTLFIGLVVLKLFALAALPFVRLRR